ncbi:D-2-hydroxyacid dehydrogenase [Candidatus Halobonum tyrrellensis]|uniref:Phosphoglycerate dehydrogenase n=1 Tax=Candidatus Halobonum tyrrellensis G22 TaxID=1324957 RepID=V4HHC1_9EURY|nr:D-2-hydroxyacid dehydrogenase [Candidatus Halobonum tyrrellensis]ESP90160.1 phosphoglycerate dehydrogenase [Candidatus Halobonum tyrrellensis G22]
MSDGTTVLLHHSVTGVFGDELGEELHSRLESSLPAEVAIETSNTPTRTERAIGDADAVLTIRDVSGLLDDAPDLRWVQTLNAGVDSYDLDRLDDRNVVVTNGSGVAARPIAEQVLGYAFVFERRIHRGIRQQERNGVWERYAGGELGGKTVGVVGVGAIGTEVAELATALDMEVVGTKRDPDTAPDVVDEVYPPEGLDRVLERADYLVLSCPLVESTRGLIGSRELMAMKSEAVLINVARGGVVDQPALETALQQGRIRGAALDVFEEEPLPADSVLWELSNVVVTPHMAGSTPRYAERIAALFADNYERFAAGKLDELENRVL